MEKSFAQAEMARKVHHNLRKERYINQTMRTELHTILPALTSNAISKATPIAHLIPERDDGDCYGDASLIASGGWPILMIFWWCIPWDDRIKK